ncbi:MarR family transcriptional regulator [Pendulispora brunnea]|uniref:MarR family transcriptional regulator n=1 Tax=Pendulispora brunnea TaxID=2905690 RepID=A0ABZ2KLA5_9BACT
MTDPSRIVQTAQSVQTQQPPSVLLAEELHRLVVRTKKVLWRTASRTLESRGESVFTWPILNCLVRNGPSAQKDIAESTGQHPAGLSRLIEELEQKKLIRRKVDRNDRRRQLVEVTPKGRTWVEEHTPAVYAAVDQVMSGLDDEERRTLRALLLKLLAGAE